MLVDKSSVDYQERLAAATQAAFATIVGATPRVHRDHNEYLRTALEQCASARDLIEPEQAKFRPLISSATSEIERNARQYQHDLIAWQLERAAAIAEKRLAYFKLHNPATEESLCKNDIHHWFDYYAWGYDPRPDSPLQIMPLDPFPFQDRYLDWLNYLVFDLRASGVVEKSRDMGATVLGLAWSVYHWRYTNHFSVMVSSATEELVDSKKDPDTLFEKVRFLIKLQPSWWLPKGFNIDRDMPYMNIANPENGAVITGTAPTAKVGRQRRRTAVIGDEFQTWQFGGYPQHTALSQTVKSFIALGTPEGRFNKYADLAHDGRTPKFEMDWRDHPWKDERWYKALPYGYFGPAMTDETVAQEIDRNYEASQPGRVIKNCKEEYCFITWTELVEGFASQGKDVRSGRVPEHWNWGRVSDYGISAKTEDDTHIWAYNLFARPPKSWPLNDSLFFFYALPIEPIGASELEAFRFYSGLEQSLGLRTPQGFVRRPQVNDMSHEAKDAKSVLLAQCGDNWNIPDLDFFDGVSKLRFHFELTGDQPNPFRPQLEGRSRIYFVAPDDEYHLGRNDRSGAWFVTASRSQLGFKRLRRELQSWHFPPEERGKPVQKMRPKAEFDDIVTTIRYALARWGVKSAPLTPSEIIENSLRPEVRLPAIVAEINPAVQQAKIQSRDLYIKRLEAENKNRDNRLKAAPRVRFVR